MYFLLTDCQNPDILRIIYFISEILNVAFIIIPIMLIVMTIIDLTKGVINADYKNNKLKSSDVAFVLVIKRIMSAIIVFFIPLIVNLVLSIVSNDDSQNYLNCLKNANITTINYLQNIVDAEKQQLLLEKEELIKKAAQNPPTSVNTIPYYFSNSNGVKTTAQFAKPVTTVVGYGTSSDTYCSVSNSRQSIIHDIGVSVGTEVYAPISGTATFYQEQCLNNDNPYLMIYGNKIVISGDNNLSAVMGHFNEFYINNSKVKGDVTDSCNSIGKNCSKCQSGDTKLLKQVATAEVKAGELIGYSGNTGNSGGPHLHLELSVDGKTCVVDPWTEYFKMR